MRTYDKRPLEIWDFSERAAKTCACYVIDGVGFDPFGNRWAAITDDHGNIVFVQNRERFGKSWQAWAEE